MEDMLTLKEILAMLIRRGKLLVCMTVAFAVLLGGVQAVKQISAAQKEENSPEKIEDRYQESVEEYKENKESLEYQLSRAEKKSESQKEYNDNSLKMQFDPYNVSVTTISFAITDIDDDAFQMVYQIEGTPVDYIISQIQNRYLLYWNSLDLSKDLSQSSYRDSEDKYLRELVSLDSANSGGLILTVQGKSQQDAKRLADAVYQCLLAIQPTIAESSYAHQFVVINEVTKVLVDEGLADTQRSNLDQIKVNQDAVDSLKKQLEDLKEPEREKGYSVVEIMQSTAKWATLGVFLGAFLACVWIAIAYIFRRYTESVRRVEAVSSLTFLGSSQQTRSRIYRLSQKVLGEQGWRDQAEACSYLKESLRVSLPEGTHVAILSTIPLDTPGVQVLNELFASLGYKAQLVPNAVSAPEAISAVRSCQCVVLLVEIGVTRWPDISRLQGAVQRMGKTISGFITL